MFRVVYILFVDYRHSSLRRMSKALEENVKSSILRDAREFLFRAVASYKIQWPMMMMLLDSVVPRVSVEDESP